MFSIKQDYILFGNNKIKFIVDNKDSLWFNYVQVLKTLGMKKIRIRSLDRDDISIRKTVTTDEISFETEQFIDIIKTDLDKVNDNIVNNKYELIENTKILLDIIDMNLYDLYKNISLLKKY